MKFKQGDSVIIKHQPDIGTCKVLDPCEPTSMVRVVTKEPVGYYVVIETSKGEKCGYHENSLQKVE